MVRTDSPTASDPERRRQELARNKTAGEGHIDPRIGGGDVVGRIGTIFRICSPVFDDYVTVHFAAQGRKKIGRIRMLPLEIVSPTD